MTLRDLAGFSVADDQFSDPLGCSFTYPIHLEILLTWTVLSWRVVSSYTNKLVLLLPVLYDEAILNLLACALYLRHKLYKSCGDPPIFHWFLFFGIGRSSPDFFDLEPCRKSHAPDVWRPPPGDCSATARFTLQMTKISGDGPTTIGRGPGSDCRGTCWWSSDAKKSYDHPTIFGRSPFRASCSHRWVR